MRADGTSLRERTRFKGSTAVTLALALAVVTLCARDFGSATDDASRLLAALGVLAGLAGAATALRVGRRPARPALVPPAEPPLAFEAAPRPTAGAEKRPAREGAPTTVLVIDGHDESRELLARGLAREGVHVITAGDWEQGLRRARDVRPDLITLDALLPETDAWAMLRALKDDAQTAQIPVIMTT